MLGYLHINENLISDLKITCLKPYSLYLDTNVTVIINI